MWKQIMLLTKIQLLGLFGFNQVRYGHDRKKRNRLFLLGGSMFFVAFAAVSYIVLLTVGCINIGMGNVVPSYILAVISVMILFFTTFKAGSILFQMSTYEMLISLPVKPVAIVISRFLNMYIMNMLLCLVAMVPVAVVYGIMLSPGLIFYITLFVGAVLLPLLPMTIATAAGALIMGISSRVKYKNFISIILTIGFVVGIMVLTFGLSPKMTEENMPDLAVLENIAKIIQTQIHSLYPPSVLFTEAVVNGNLGALLGFAGISVGLFILMVYLVQIKFVSICNALSAKKTLGNYKLQELSQKSPLLALYKRELARYFASSLYVMNTAMGPVLMVLLAIGIASTGVDKVEQLLEMPGIISIALPILLGCVCGLNSTTTCCISIEGKNWWIAKNLPVTSSQIFNSKIMVNLTIALPSYLLSEVILLIALKPDWMTAFWLVIMPLVYIFFTSVMGLTMNLKMPVFQWESEAAVVKQGGAVFMGMLVSLAASILPIVALFMLRQIPAVVIMGGTVLILGAATVLMYWYISKVDIRTIE